MKFAFFGTDEFAVHVLETLKSCGLIPTLIISTPDKPKGRKLLLTPPPVKVWSVQQQIEVLQPEQLKDTSFIESLEQHEWDFFLVAAYGKIIPEHILNIPTRGTLNIHPSLLPLLRGPSPVATAILNDMKQTGVSLMRIDEKMDHGPIIAQQTLTITEWPERDELEKTCAIIGANLLADSINEYLSGTLVPQVQDDTHATYCHMITKDMGHIDLNDDVYTNWRKIQALHGWPGTWFFVQHGEKTIRVSIRKAHYRDNVLTIETIVPEGKKEMSYDDFLRGL
jgi:methionyl-tRNA formyltransferase